MNYQQIFGASAPYIARPTSIREISMHLHHEIEAVSCISGSFTVKINDRSEKINAGDTVFVGSMTPHAYSSEEACSCILIEAGPIFLNKNFKYFSFLKNDLKVYRKNENPVMDKLIAETAEEIKEKNIFSDMALSGSVYKIFAEMLKDYSAADAHEEKNEKGTKRILDIEKALEAVYYHYNEPITVDEMAALTGYGKSNFCKIFKSVTSMSFHRYLNDYRIQNAKYLLSETDCSVEEIASMVGFSDQKSFYRVFKAITGKNPGKFRNADEGE